MARTPSRKWELNHNWLITGKECSFDREKEEQTEKIGNLVATLKYRKKMYYTGITCARGAISSVFRITSTVIGPHSVITMSIVVTGMAAECTLVHI